jgi:pantoate--beta-alanine ligase
VDAIIHDIVEMQRRADEERTQGRRIAVVPTMGALHEGHGALIRTACMWADVVVTTVFVNPTQFGPGEDFARYPRDLQRDAAFAEAAGCNILFAPAAESMYPAGFCTHVDVERLGAVLEGKSRPGHFRGVLTVVTKLLLITRPHVAVFGQKDAQQVVLVRQMLRDLNFGVDLVVVPIVREADGLALSSRNAYLSAGERLEATVLYRALQQAESAIRGGERVSAAVIGAMRRLIEETSSGVIDYISIADARSLRELSRIPTRSPVLVSLAVRFGETRLIDNLFLTL